MSKVKMVRPLVAMLPPRIGRAPGEKERDRDRERTQPWRKLYHSARWRKLREKILTRDQFTCQMVGCGRTETDTSKLVADHKMAHRGNENLFWSEANLQCLCKECHDRLKQVEDKRGPSFA